MSAALDLPAIPLLPRIRACGAAVELRDGRPVMVQASRLPRELLEKAKARRGDLIGEIEAEAAAADLAYEATERAAIIGDGEYRNPWQWVAHKLPPSWPAPEYEPTAGAHCSCCRGNAWWCEATEPKGWRCSICHPPLGLAVGAVREVRT